MPTMWKEDCMPGNQFKGRSIYQNPFIDFFLLFVMIRNESIIVSIHPRIVDCNNDMFV